MLFDMIHLIWLCCRSATVCEAIGPFSFLVRDRKQAKKCNDIVCYYSWNILVYIHVGDDAIVACRGTELKEFFFFSWKLSFSLGMLTFHSKSAFLLYKISTELPKLAFTFFIQLHHQIYCTNPSIYCIYIILHIICIYAMNIPCSI